MWEGPGAVERGLTTREGRDAVTDGEHPVHLGWGSYLDGPVGSARGSGCQPSWSFGSPAGQVSVSLWVGMAWVI